MLFTNLAAHSTPLLEADKPSSGGGNARLPDPITASFELESKQARAKSPSGKVSHVPKAERFRMYRGVEDASLNERQREAVNHLDGPAKVVAPPGSGKTRVVTLRIAKLLSLGVPPSRLLAVSFTKKAALEMKERVQELIGSETKWQPQISTIHKLCYSILSEYGELVGQKGGKPRIAIDYERDEYLREALKEVPFDVETVLGKRPAEEFSTRIGRMKNQLIHPEDARRSRDDLAEPYIAYQRWLQDTNRMDLDDLIRLTVRILEDPKHGAQIADSLRADFDYVMIDEYQDNSAAQDRLLDILAKDHRNLFVVGDPRQSIYWFRGGDIGRIETFQKRWRGASEYQLIENYRSTPQIVKVANDLMAGQISDDMQLIATRPDGPPPMYRVYNTYVDEAQGIAAHIKELTKQGHQPRDIAILIRKKSQAEVLGYALVNEGIRFSVPEENLRLGRVKRDIFSLMNAAHDADDSDPAFLRLLRDTRYKVSPAFFESILLERRKQPTIWAALQSPGLRAGLEGEFKPEGSPSLPELIEELHERSTNPKRRQRLDKILFDGMRALYPDWTAKKLWDSVSEDFVALVRANQTLEDLEEDNLSQKIQVARLKIILERVKSHDQGMTIGRASFSSYLESVDRLFRYLKDPSLQKTKQEAEEERLNEVRVMTIHAAKGMEFPVVFLPGLVEGIHPTAQDIEAYDMRGDEARIDEARRLVFVGVSRAKDLLVMSRYLKKDQRRRRPEEPSRFAGEAHLGRYLDFESSLLVPQTQQDLLDVGRVSDKKPKSRRSRRR